MMGDSLGDRIKRYEAVSAHTLTPNCPVFIRVDGKAFHTWTRGLDKPFDIAFINAMTNAAIDTAREMQGFKLAYAQSDEATFMLDDADSPETQPWFGNELSKLISVSASAFTAYFAREAAWKLPAAMPPAMFDARAFSVPEADAPNVFVWRQKDWYRNSVQMCAQWHYSHKQLEGKKLPELHEMLYARGLNWADLDPVLKNGTFIDRKLDVSHDQLSYYGVQGLIGATPAAGSGAA
jgi:tRNA(His) guanylyltransferase